jgi:hypothetical protein
MEEKNKLSLCMTYVETRTELELLQKDEIALLVELESSQELVDSIKKDLKIVRRKIKKEQKNPSKIK